MIFKSTSVLALVLATTAAFAQFTPSAQNVEMPKPNAPAMLATPVVTPVLMPKPAANTTVVSTVKTVSMPKPYSKSIKPAAVVATNSSK